MNQLTKSKALRELLIFAAPIIFGHIGIMLVATGDMIIAGHYSRECLAAIGLAVSISNPVLMIGLGILFATSPLLAQKRGRGENIEPYFWSVISYSLIIGVICCGMQLLSILLLPYLGYSENLNRIIYDYLLITSFSLIPNCLYQGVKEYLQAQEKTFAANILAIIAVGVNLFFNYAFVFGKLGMPNLAEPGLAYASTMVRIFMGVGLLIVAFRRWKNPFSIKWDFFREVTRIGFPITVSIFFEVMAFCSVTLFVGKFNDIQVAANNIALNAASLAFMIPLSIASAVGVKVGHAYGEKNFTLVRTFAQVSLMATLSFTALMCLAFSFFPDTVITLYNTDADVLVWGRILLFWVACFQLFDGSQVTLSGILRGLSVTRPASIAIFIGYWIIGIPLGYYLGFHRGMEAQGFWIGLALSLALVSLMLGFILISKLKKLLSGNHQSRQL